MLNIDQITVSYGQAPALVDVSLRVEQGELVTLLGSNGAGKSTLLKTISGILRPRSGRIAFNGREIHNAPSHQIVQAGVVHVPEGRQVFTDLTVQENLRMGAFTRRDHQAVEHDLEFVLKLFPRLKERRHQLAGTMSGGEAQMVAIARGILSAPKLLMLDEPSLGLAPVVRADIFDAISQLHQQSGLTILLVEQNAKWALHVATRAYVLENGRVIMEGSGQDLINDENVQQAYLGY